MVDKKSQLYRTPRRNFMSRSAYEVVIVGGGPAGLAAGIWCADLGLSAIMIEKRVAFGGQLNRIYNPIRNYPGGVFETGSDLLGRFLDRADEYGFERKAGIGVASINASERTVKLSNGEILTAWAIIVATGVRRRKLGIPGESEFEGRGVMDSGAGEKESVRGKRVLIVGGGDAAFENALILAQYADKVYLVHRREHFTARQEFVGPVMENARIEVVRGAELKQIEGGAEVESATLIGKAIGESRIIEAERILIRIGVRPNTDLLRGQVDLDREGYVVVDRFCAASAKGIFGAGDAANPISPTIVTAAGMGATAAKAAYHLIKEEKRI